MKPEDLEAYQKKILDAIIHKIGALPDPKTQYEFLANPDNLQTMTYLKPSQCKFVTLAEWTAQDYPTAFGTYKTWSKELMETMKSEKGRGIDAIINYARSLRASPAGSSVNIFSQLKDKVSRFRGNKEEKIET